MTGLHGLSWLDRRIGAVESVVVLGNRLD